MTEIKEITAMCRAGRLQEAYQRAKSDLEANPNDVWAQRALGWALYYSMKNDAEGGNFDLLLTHLDELLAQEMLTVENDSMIFDNMQLQIGEFVKRNLSPNSPDSLAKLSSLFLRLKSYHYHPSLGHSLLLQNIIKFEMWQEMVDFFDWWDMDSLTQEDYTPYVTSQGQKMMTLAERAFIANAKALLKQNDKGRIEVFLPRLERLMAEHEEMMYPGYFYGKLLLALGSDADEALKVLIPFARKKSTEFWVWQLLSDVFTNEEEKQLACLLRAVHCRTQESFLGKVRIKLAALYIKQQQFGRARHHIDTVTRCYASQGWRLPYEIDYWLHQDWLNQTPIDSSDPIDYKTITDAILCNGAEECVAVVTYLDAATKRVSMVYGYQQRMSQKLRFNVKVGDVLHLHYITDKEGRIKVLTTKKVALPDNLNYAKQVEGVISKRPDKEFAFMKAGAISSFVSAALVQRGRLTNGASVYSLIVLDYDRKKETWNWSCVNVKLKQ